MAVEASLELPASSTAGPAGDTEAAAAAEAAGAIVITAAMPSGLVAEAATA